MDFNKLTLEELNSFFNMYSVTPTGNPYQYAALLFNQIGSQGRFPEPIVDLYIASQIAGKIQIPPNYNIEELNSRTFLELAKIFSLPLEDTPEIRNRAKRILRILRPFVQVIPVMYKGPNQIGDFAWMITQPEYQDVLFIFNDNQEQFIALLKGQNSGCVRGGGNAVIRPYQCINPPRAAGIPTGVNQQGYTNLEQSRSYIDLAIERIKQLLGTGNYKRVMYSSANDGRSLGTSIFSPSQDVKEYIVNRIEELSK